MENSGLSHSFKLFITGSSICFECEKKKVPALPIRNFDLAFLSLYQATFIMALFWGWGEGRIFCFCFNIPPFLASVYSRVILIFCPISEIRHCLGLFGLER